MAFGGFDSGGSKRSHPLTEINMVPLIDVMLVLLVIFMITAPLLTHSIKIDVPKVSSEPVTEDPKSVDIAVNEDGVIFVNNVETAMEDLKAFFVSESNANPDTNFRVRADANTRYEIIANIMASAKGSGVKRLGFITSPSADNPTTDSPKEGAAENSTKK